MSKSFLIAFSVLAFIGLPWFIAAPLIAVVVLGVLCWPKAPQDSQDARIQRE